MPIATTNPVTGEVLKTFDPLPPEQIDRAIGRSVAAYAALRRTSFADRAAWMGAAADLLEAEQDDVGALMTLEIGKTFTGARAEVVKCPVRAARPGVDGVSRVTPTRIEEWSPATGVVRWCAQNTTPAAPSGP